MTATNTMKVSFTAGAVCFMLSVVLLCVVELKKAVCTSDGKLYTDDNNGAAQCFVECSQVSKCKTISKDIALFAGLSMLLCVFGFGGSYMMMKGRVDSVLNLTYLFFITACVTGVVIFSLLFTISDISGHSSVLPLLTYFLVATGFVAMLCWIVLGNQAAKLRNKQKTNQQKIENHEEDTTTAAGALSTGVQAKEEEERPIIPR